MCGEDGWADTESADDSHSVEIHCNARTEELPELSIASANFTILMPRFLLLTSVALQLLLLGLFPGAAHCQWMLVAKLPTSVIEDIIPLRGGSVIIVCADSGIFRSADAGVTWSKLPGFGTGYNVDFKNDTVGWLSADPLQDTPYYGTRMLRTTDAGLTWATLTTPSPPLHISYQQSTSKLFCVSWVPSGSTSYSTDDGDTWHTAATSRNGIAFVDDNRLVVGDAGGMVSVSNNAGKTWNDVGTASNETWQPLAIPGTDTILSASEQGTACYSPDAGSSWIPLPSTPSHTFTGTATWCNCGDVVLSQSMRSKAGGVMYSSDIGQTWSSLGGPTNAWDTRFFSGQDYVYAGNDHGELWRYSIRRNPTVTSPDSIRSCDVKDTTLHISFTNACFGIPATLDSIAITGSSAFGFPSLKLPHPLASEESLTLRYSPRIGLRDTARIYLRFNQHGDVKDTVMWVYGNAVPEQSLSLRCAASVSHAGIGAPTVVGIYPNKVLRGVFLDTIQFTLAYTGDVLQFLTANSTDAVSFGSPTRQGTEELLPISITGKDLSFDPANPIATLSFNTVLSDSLHTRLSIRNPKANPGDPSYTACALSLSSDSDSFSVDLVCRDSLLLRFMSTGSPFQIKGVQPNPLSSSTTLNLSSTESASAQITIHNLLGTEVARLFSGELGAGEHSFTWDAHGIPPGMYECVVRMGGSVQHVPIILER